MVYDEDSISNKSQLVTLALLLFFGSLGAHRFYVRKYITGIIYFLIGSTPIVLKLLGIGYAAIANAAFRILFLMDLYALYSDSFTDKKGNLVLGNSKTLVYETDQEREEILFTDKLNKILLFLGAIAFYIFYYVFINTKF